MVVNRLHFFLISNTSWQQNNLSPKNPIPNYDCCKILICFLSMQVAKFQFFLVEIMNGCHIFYPGCGFENSVERPVSFGIWRTFPCDTYSQQGKFARTRFLAAEFLPLPPFAECGLRVAILFWPYNPVRREFSPASGAALWLITIITPSGWHLIKMRATHIMVPQRAWETARISRGEIDCTRWINSRCWQIQRDPSLGDTKSSLSRESVSIRYPML